MKRLLSGATLLCAAFSADAGLIRADFRTGADLPGYGKPGAGDELDEREPLANDSRWDSGDAWLDLAMDTLPLQAQDQAGFHAAGITFLTESPPADPTPIPEPATLALFGLGACALGLARQGKGKRACSGLR